MQTTVLCPEIPEHLRNGMSQPKAAAIFLEKSVKDSLGRIPLNGTGRLLRIEVDDSLFHQLPLHGEDIPRHVLMGEYINAAVAKLKSTSRPPADSMRTVYQQRFYDGIAPEIAAGKIVLAEGATGIGKGRVLARIAREQAEIGNGPVAIAAPSVAVLKQLIEEWLKAGYPVSGVSCVLGRQQFVDTNALKDIISSPSKEVAEVLGEDKITIVKNWLATGCPPSLATRHQKPSLP